MAQKLLKACEDATTIVAYNASFEMRCIEQIASVVPELSSRLLSLNSKFVDLLPIVRNNVYHPDFLGSFSIKSVYPALLPELDSHSQLEIADGMTASLYLEKVLTGQIEYDNELIAHLLKYCELDSLAMVRLTDKLINWQIPCLFDG